MHWVFGGVTLLVVAAVLRRILRLDASNLPRYYGMVPLDASREMTYDPVAREIETRTEMLAVSLNDAFEERNIGNRDMAWRLARLAACELERFSEVLMILLNSLTDHVPDINLATPMRRMSASLFKTRTMSDYVRMHELLSQFVFRPRLKFQLQLRMLRRAVETISQEFQKECKVGQRNENGASLDCWKRLDLYYHDFDLIAKEAQLALRAFLANLPDELIPPFGLEARAIVRNSVRSKSIAAGE